MRYAIVYKRTGEYVSFFEDGKAILFTDSEEKAQEELNDILFADGGYDDNVKDFSIEIVDFDTDGGEFVKEGDVFVDRSLIK